MNFICPSLIKHLLLIAVIAICSFAIPSHAVEKSNQVAAGVLANRPLYYLMIYAAIIVTLLVLVLVGVHQRTLAKINRELRAQMEARLLAEKNLQQLNNELEATVEQRTNQVQEALKEKDILFEQVRLNEERYRKLVDNSIAGIGISHEDKILFVNQALCDMLGIANPDEIQSKSILDFAAPGSKQRILDIIEKLRTGETPPNYFEHEIIRKDGEIRTLSLQMSAIEYLGRTCHQSTVIDITDKKRLEESEARFKNMAAALPSGIVEMDENLVITYINRTGLQIFGYTQADIENGLMGIELLHPDDREKAAQRIAGYQAGNYVPPTEYRVLKKNGADTPVLFKAVPMLKEGKISGYMGSVTDISQLKEAEKELRENRTKLRDSNRILSGILENTHFMTAYMDTRFNFIWVNKAYADLNKQEPVCFAGKNHFSLFPDREHQAIFQRVVDTGIPFFASAEQFGGPALTERATAFYDWSLIPIKGEDNRVDHLALTLVDVTDRKRVREKIESALKEKETLLQEIHHRVKNNMNVISSLLELHSSSARNKNVRAALKESQARIYTMSAVHESLYKSKSLSEIDLNDYLSKLLRTLIRTYSVNSKRVTCSITGDALLLSLEKASPLGLCVNELVSNSLKYAFPDHQSGKININLTSDDDFLEMSLQDNGLGMPDGFDWKKTDSLGLKLVRTLVENQLDGSIELSNSAGTTFTIRIPKDVSS